MKTENGIGRSGFRRFALWAAAVVFIGAISFAVLVRVMLSGSSAAEKVGEILSEYAGRKVTVAAIVWKGGSVTLKGIAVSNPSGYRERELLAVRSLTLSPELTGLLRAKASLSRLEIEGLRLNLEKGAEGEWNFSGLLGNLRKRKGKSGREVFIRRLLLKDATVSVNGSSLEHLGLAVDDLSTKGSTPSRLSLTARDPNGNPFRLEAEGRLGPAPSLHLTFASPTASLSPLASILPPASPLLMADGKSAIDFKAEIRWPLIIAKGRAGFDGIGLRIGPTVKPIRGSIDISGRYDAERDEIALEHAAVALNERLAVRAAGSAERVRKDFKFALRLSHDTIPLREILSFMPPPLLRGAALEGTLSSMGIHLEGDRARGVTGCGGKLSVRLDRLAAKDRFLLRGAGMELLLGKGRGGCLVKGRLFAPAGLSEVPLGALDAPFTVLLSPRLKPKEIELPAVTARVLDGRLSGSFRFIPAATPRFRAECRLGGASLAALNRYLEGTALRLSSGATSVAVQLSGDSPLDFAGKVSAGIASAAGTAGTGQVSFREALLHSALRYGNRGLAVEGRIKVEGGLVDGMPCGASLDFSLTNRDLRVAKALMTIDRSRILLQTASLRLPSGDEKNGGEGIPIAAVFAGVEVSRGDLLLSGLSGAVDCRYSSSANGRLLNGSVRVADGMLAYRGARAATLAGAISLRGREAVAEIGGESLGGAFETRLTIPLFTPNRETGFKLRLHKQRLELLSPFLPANSSPRPSGGTADASLEGSFGRGAGLNARVSMAGRHLSLRGADNRIILSGAGLRLESVLAGGDLKLKEGTLEWSGGPVVRAYGEVRRLFRDNREGSVAVSMGAVGINSLLDIFANALPRNLQEAVGGGSCRLEGKLDVRGGEVLAQGSVLLEKASLEIASQKVLVAGIDGRIPFSLPFPRQGPDRRPSPPGFNRENFPKLIKESGRIPRNAITLHVGKARFGALETGGMTFFITADKGMTEINSIRVSLYDGTLTGSGFLTFNKGLRYGGDFLLEDLSLRQFCASFPKIKGYMTGRVDGVISLANENGGLGGLAGYVNLWTRSGKGEKMLVSKEFLQKLAGKKLRGFLFRNDRPYDNGEIIAYLRGGFLTFERLDISHTNILGMKDLSVSVAPVQNRIAIEHLLESIREAAARGKTQGEGEGAPVQTDLRWLE